MGRLFRSLLLVVAGAAMIAGTFVPWITWNNLFGKPTAGGQWSVQDGHRDDPRIVYNGFGATGGFKVTHKKFDGDGGVVRQFTVISPGDTRSEREVGNIPLAAGVVLLVLAALRIKWLVSALALGAAAAAVYPFVQLRSWVPHNAPLLQETGMPVDPLMGAGLYVLLGAAVVAVIAAAVVWLEPKRPPRPAAA